MLVSDFISEAQTVMNSTDQTYLFRAITRAVQLLEPAGLFDPLIGYLDFSVDGSYYVALPAIVKSPIRININNNPAFNRAWIFEFSQNTDGTVEGAELNWSWGDRGTMVIQNEEPLPGTIQYLATATADNGKTVTINGRDQFGNQIQDTLIAAVSNPAASTNIYYTIDTVRRDSTTAPCFLNCLNGTPTVTTPIARYDSSDTEPRYRAIKLSQTNVAIRMKFRRKTFAIASLDDIIPMDSPMAMATALDAVKALWEKDYQRSDAAIQIAIKIAVAEQRTRDEANSNTTDQEGITATNTNLGNLEGIIVGDIYDEACKITGGIGRQKVFDFITDTVEALGRVAHWDSMIGWVDIQKPSSLLQQNYLNNEPGDGYFVLPRNIEAPLAINENGRPGQARNGWFEFHLNGTGEQRHSDPWTWDDLGNVCVINEIPLTTTYPNSNTNLRTPIPQQFVCIPDLEQDNNTCVRVYGFDANNRWIQVDGCDGILVPCIQGQTTPNPDAPGIIKITRVTKAQSQGPIQMLTVDSTNTLQLLMGWWYPDEVEPTYRAIKISHTMAARIRVRYKMRRRKITSMYDLLHLRSRLAIVAMMRALNMEKTDPAGAEAFRSNALRYLKEEQRHSRPPGGFEMQFDHSVPTVSGQLGY